MTDQERTTDQRVVECERRVRALEAELPVSQQQGMTLFSEAPAPYLLLNSQGRLQEVNTAACGLLGRTREVLPGKRLSGFFTPESRSSFDLLLRQVPDGGLTQRGEGRVLRADDAPFDVLLDVDASIVDGEFQHFRLIVTDITAHGQVQQNLLDSTVSQERQLQEHGARIRALNQELEQIVTTFLQQLHLPTARAMNFLGRLRQALGEQPEQVTQPLLNTERAVLAVIALLATLNRYMGLRGMRVRLQRLDLNKVLDQVLKETQPQRVGRNIRITSAPPAHCAGGQPGPVPDPQRGRVERGEIHQPAGSGAGACHGVGDGAPHRGGGQRPRLQHAPEGQDCSIVRAAALVQGLRGDRGGPDDRAAGM